MKKMFVVKQFLISFMVMLPINVIGVFSNTNNNSPEFICLKFLFWYVLSGIIVGIGLILLCKKQEE